MNGRLVAGDEDRYVTGFSIDTRTLATGDLFFAIVAKRGRSYFRWLWIVALPLAFAAVVTITASMLLASFSNITR